jgi:ribose transport system permease protein
MQNGSSTASGATNPTGGILTRVQSALAPRKISGVYLWIALIVFYSLATSTFFSGTTARTIATEQAVTAIVAMGLTIALAAGVFDLSIAGTMGLANIIVAKLMADAGLPIVVAILLTLLVGALIGVVNGLLVVKARIDPFIATLGTNSILLAAIFVVSNNQNVLGIPAGFQKIAGNQLLGIPLPVFYVLILAVVLWYVLACTPLGRRLYATGGGRDVARLAGVPTTRYVIGAFVASAVIASLAGVLVVATIGTGSTEVGQSYLLPAFAAGFLGATQFRPGRFNIWGTVLAVYLLATGVKGLVLMGADVWVPDLFNGLALIIAVGLSGIQRRPKVKAAPTTGDEPPKASTDEPTSPAPQRSEPAR